MGDMLDDVGGEFHKKYPVIAFLQRKLENQTQEEKDKSHENIVKLLTTCGFQNTLALLGKHYVKTNISPGVFTNPIASFRRKKSKNVQFSDLRKTGIADQGDNSDNTSITYVAEESLEGFGDYDYDDYYDDEEEVEPEPEPEDTNDDHSNASPESEPDVTEDTGTLNITIKDIGVYLIHIIL